MSINQITDEFYTYDTPSFCGCCGSKLDAQVRPVDDNDKDRYAYNIHTGEREYVAVFTCPNAREARLFRDANMCQRFRRVEYAHHGNFEREWKKDLEGCLNVNIGGSAPSI